MRAGIPSRAGVVLVHDAGKCGFGFRSNGKFRVKNNGDRVAGSLSLQRYTSKSGAVAMACIGLSLMSSTGCVAATFNAEASASLAVSSIIGASSDLAATSFVSTEVTTTAIVGGDALDGERSFRAMRTFDAHHLASAQATVSTMALSVISDANGPGYNLLGSNLVQLGSIEGSIFAISPGEFARAAGEARAIGGW